MIAIETHQPADASPRATSSAQRSATPGAARARRPRAARRRAAGPSPQARHQLVGQPARALGLVGHRGRRRGQLAGERLELRAGRGRRLRLGLGHRSSLAHRSGDATTRVVQRLHRYGGRTMGAADDLSHRFDGESVGRTLGLVGERWTLLILREAFFGVRRFGQLARNLGIPRPTLSARLRTLVDAGLLARVPYARDPDRHEYRLTDAGRDLFPAHRDAHALGRRPPGGAARGRRSSCATTPAAS